MVKDNIRNTIYDHIKQSFFSKDQRFPPLTFLDKVKSFADAIVDTDYFFSQIHFEGNEIEELIVAFEYDELYQEKAACLAIFKASEKFYKREAIKKICTEIAKKFKINWISVALPVDKHSYIASFLEVGFEKEGYLSTGKASLALEALSVSASRTVIEEFKTTVFDYKIHRELVIEIEKLAHLGDKDSPTHKFSNNTNNISVYEDMEGFLLFSNDSKAIGFLGYYLNYNGDEIPFLSSLSINPEYQGHGGAKILFSAFLNEIRNKGLDDFSFVTNSNKLIPQYERFHLIKSDLKLVLSLKRLK